MTIRSRIIALVALAVLAVAFVPISATAASSTTTDIACVGSDEQTQLLLDAAVGGIATMTATITADVPADLEVGETAPVQFTWSWDSGMGDLSALVQAVGATATAVMTAPVAMTVTDGEQEVQLGALQFAPVEFDALAPPELAASGSVAAPEDGGQINYRLDDSETLSASIFVVLFVYGSSGAFGQTLVLHCNATDPYIATTNITTPAPPTTSVPPPTSTVPEPPTTTVPPTTTIELPPSVPPVIGGPADDPQPAAADDLPVVTPRYTG